MTDNLDRYVPEFNEEEMRTLLSAQNREELIEMLLRSYKQTRVVAKMADELGKKLAKIQGILEEPSGLLKMPPIPNPDDLRRMNE